MKEVTKSEVADSDNDEFEQKPFRGLVFDPAEPDYLNYHDRDEGAQVILTMEEVQDVYSGTRKRQRR